MSDDDGPLGRCSFFCEIWNPWYVAMDVGQSARRNAKCLTLTTLFLGMILGIILVACSLQRVGSTDVGLTYHRIQRHLDSQVLSEGLHTIPTFGTMVTWPSTYQTVSFTNITCNSRDGVVVENSITLQYDIDLSQVYNLTLTYVSFARYHKVVSLASESAISRACAMYTAREFQTRRSNVTATMNLITRNDIANLYANVIELQLINVLRPDSYEEAVRSKETALANITLARQQRQQLVTTANTQLLVAKKNANMTLHIANTTAAVILANAQVQALTLEIQYRTYLSVFRAVQEAQNLTTEGLLAYIGTRVIASMDAVGLRMDAPAQASWRSEL